MMANDLPQLVRATYDNAVLMERDATAAFERAVGILLGRRERPLRLDAARREVAAMLTAGSRRQAN